jgi:hypothetical protein
MRTSGHAAKHRLLLCASAEVTQGLTPSAGDVTAHDVAEGIALHHAATARAVAAQVREDLIAIDGASANGHAPETTTARRRALADAARVTALTETSFHLDHQLSRLLRRIGDGDAAGGPGRGAPSEVARRYRWALDELRSLEADCRLTAESVSQAISAHEHEQRERFHFVAAALATAILVPALVVSLYGANVTLPGKGGGFAGLVVFIIASEVGALLLVIEAGRRGWEAPDWRIPHRWRRGRASVATPDGE